MGTAITDRGFYENPLPVKVLQLLSAAASHASIRASRIPAVALVGGFEIAMTAPALNERSHHAQPRFGPAIATVEIQLTVIPGHLHVPHAIVGSFIT